MPKIEGPKTDLTGWAIVAWVLLFLFIIVPGLKAIIHRPPDAVEKEWDKKSVVTPVFKK